MMKAKVLLAMVAVVGLATVAQASVTVETERVATINGLEVYHVHLVATHDDQVTAFDGQFTGPLHQVWQFNGVLQTPTLSIVDPSYTDEDLAQDSHFMFTDDQLIVVEAPNEDGPDFGTYLRGIFGILPEATADDLLFAQIVLPAGESAVLEGIAADAEGDKFPLSAVIPEPATLSLLVLGGLALLRRKRG